MMQVIKNIFYLGKKEILSLCRDWLLMALIVYSFTCRNSSRASCPAAAAMSMRSAPAAA